MLPSLLRSTIEALQPHIRSQRQQPGHHRVLALVGRQHEGCARPEVIISDAQIHRGLRVESLPVLRHEPVDGRHVPVLGRQVDGLHGSCCCWYSHTRGLRLLRL